MKGPSSETKKVTYRYCNGCDCLLSKDLRSERLPKLNRTVHYCVHPDIKKQSEKEGDRDIVSCRLIGKHKESGRKVKTPVWCLELVANKNLQPERNRRR